MHSLTQLPAEHKPHSSSGEIEFELPHVKTNKMACAPSEDRSAWASYAQSDQSLCCGSIGS